jgi:hypothetical protein
MSPGITNTGWPSPLRVFRKRRFAHEGRYLGRFNACTSWIADSIGDTGRIPFRVWNEDGCPATILICAKPANLPYDEGLELPTLQAVPQDHWWIWLGTRCGHRPRMAIEVRDATGPMLQARFTFELEHQRQ